MPELVSWKKLSHGCFCLTLCQLENMSTRKHESLKICQLVPFYSCTDLKQVVTAEEVLLVEPRLIAELEDIDSSFGGLWQYES